MTFAFGPLPTIINIIFINEERYYYCIAFIKKKLLPT